MSAAVFSNPLQTADLPRFALQPESDAVKTRLEALADQELVALGIIVRRVLEAGLSVIEKGEDGTRQSAMEAAREWWQDMDSAQRITWQKRVAPLKGREMIAEAWKQSQGI